MENNTFTHTKKNRTAIPFLILFITIIVSQISYSCYKEKSIPPVYAEIPDANFKAYLKTIVPLAFTTDNKFISNHPSVVSYDELISIRRKKITSLSGIEYFKSITKVDCSDNQITALDISKNTALTDLYCTYNYLTRLNLDKNINLANLDCSNNQLINLDLSKNFSLIELICFNNLITTIDLGNNEVLRKIYCPYNKLTLLDVSKNKSLIELNCIVNLRNTVIIVDPNKLSRLYVDSFIICNHPSIKTFKDNGGKLFGTYSEILPPFICK